MEDFSRYYIALGLRPGATREEIRSAFRRVAKLYHPDKDASLDAEMRYHEARLAYDALIKAANTQPSHIHYPWRDWARQTVHDDKYKGPRKETKKRSTSSGAGWFAYETDTDSMKKGTDVDLDELMWEQRKGEIKSRISFSFERIPVILWESIKEAAEIGIIIRALLYAAGMRFMIYEMEYTHMIKGVKALFGSRLISNMFIFLPLAGFAMYRYYYPKQPAPSAVKDYKSYSKSRLNRNLAMSFLYGMGASVFIHVFNPKIGFSLDSLFERGIFVFVLLLLLWAG